MGILGMTRMQYCSTQRFGRQTQAEHVFQQLVLALSPYLLPSSPHLPTSSPQLLLTWASLLLAAIKGRMAAKGGSHSQNELWSRGVTAGEPCSAVFTLPQSFSYLNMHSVSRCILFANVLGWCFNVPLAVLSNGRRWGVPVLYDWRIQTSVPTPHYQLLRNLLWCLIACYPITLKEANRYYGRREVFEYTNRTTAVPPRFHLQCPTLFH